VDAVCGVVKDMTPEERQQILERARATVERVEQCRDEFAIAWADREAARQRGELDDVVERSASDGLVYKTRDDARAVPQQPQAGSDWDAWCDARIMAMFENVIVPAIGEALGEVRKQLRAEIKVARDLAKGSLTLVRSKDDDAA
jgi:hypothetical protein